MGKLVKEYEKYFPEPFIPTWVFANHDRMRRIARIKDMEKAKLHVAFQMTVRGVPYIYYGEEIGLDNPILPVKKSKDEMVLKYAYLPQFLFNFLRKVGKESFNRDECRTPMQWRPEKNAGFCPPNVKPWLPVTDSYKERNVETELKDENSLLNCYKRFLKIRKETPPLNSGSLKNLNIGDEILSYVREYKGQKVIVYLNFTNSRAKIKSEIDGKLLISTNLESHFIDDKILEPNEGLVIKVKK